MLEFIFRKIKNNVVAFLLLVTLALGMITAIYTFWAMQTLTSTSNIKQKSKRILNITLFIEQCCLYSELELRANIIHSDSISKSSIFYLKNTSLEIFSELKSLTNSDDSTLIVCDSLRNKVNVRLSEIDDVYKLLENGKRAEALSLFKLDKGAKSMADVILYSSLINKFGGLQIEKLDERNKRIAITIKWLQASSSTLVLVIVFVALYMLRFEKRKRLYLLNTLEESRKKYLIEDGSKASNNDSILINRIIDNFKHLTSFVKNIGQGDYESKMANYDESLIIKNKDSLAYELLEMRRKLYEIAQEDKRRNWASEGFAQISELLRFSTQDYQTWINKLLSFLTKYIKAEQSGIFLVEGEGEEIRLFLTAKFAYGKEKLSTQYIEIGEGLLGQAYFDKKTVLYTDIPNNYEKIESGIGEAFPNCVLIVPLVFNDQVAGVMEFASFTVFQPYQIDFLTEVSESVASFIIMFKNTEKMKNLLEEKQGQDESKSRFI